MKYCSLQLQSLIHIHTVTITHSNDRHPAHEVCEDNNHHVPCQGDLFLPCCTSGLGHSVVYTDVHDGVPNTNDQKANQVEANEDSGGIDPS